MLLALMGLAGLRLGEACGRRWRDLDTTAAPLWCLHVHDQYDGQPLKTAELGDAKERWVPVHPVLRELLTEWYQRGFEAHLGRAPRPEDPISPWPSRMVPRSEHQGGNAVERAIADTGVPRLPGRRAHSLRRSFISLARSDGARQDVLERITHNSAAATIDAYTWMGWGALCEAVAVLRVELLAAMPEGAVAHSPELGGSAVGVDRLAGLRG
jgi:integrase